jgi:hypothetical protein
VYTVADSVVPTKDHVVETDAERERVPRTAIALAFVLLRAYKRFHVPPR